MYYSEKHVRKKNQKKTAKNNKQTFKYHSCNFLIPFKQCFNVSKIIFIHIFMFSFVRFQTTEHLQHENPAGRQEVILHRYTQAAE